MALSLTIKTYLSYHGLRYLVTQSESATYCNQILQVPLYLNSTQSTQVNWIIWLLLSLLCRPNVILLSGEHCFSATLKKRYSWAPYPHFWHSWTFFLFGPKHFAEYAVWLIKPWNFEDKLTFVASDLRLPIIKFLFFNPRKIFKLEKIEMKNNRRWKECMTLRKCLIKRKTFLNSDNFFEGYKKGFNTLKKGRILIKCRTNIVTYIVKKTS